MSAAEFRRVAQPLLKQIFPGNPEHAKKVLGELAKSEEFQELLAQRRLMAVSRAGKNTTDLVNFLYENHAESQHGPLGFHLEHRNGVTRAAYFVTCLRELYGLPPYSPKRGRTK